MVHILKCFVGNEDGSSTDRPVNDNPTKKLKFWSIEETSLSNTISQAEMGIKMEVELWITLLDELASINIHMRPKRTRLSSKNS